MWASPLAPRPAMTAKWKRRKSDAVGRNTATERSRPSSRLMPTPIRSSFRSAARRRPRRRRRAPPRATCPSAAPCQSTRTPSTCRSCLPVYRPSSSRHRPLARRRRWPSARRIPSLPRRPSRHHRPIAASTRSTTKRWSCPSMPVHATIAEHFVIRLRAKLILSFTFV